MDYKKLLKAYIDHVGDMEGVSFLSDNYISQAFALKTLTPEEMEELIKMDKESYEEFSELRRVAKSDEED